ncbi:hypothetical protein QFX18_06045 [Saccharophagus degradans]|uniref:hypothetical protein n=1 Tax=Saccharophagus degradans TaxID=86304 RepID=UPI0024782414|nr:hypothetical protein [Saccharophagus degradans]WGO99624.1 hypothetical protein QFX18_06045 [Saccharophagus degradans]
MLYTLIHDSNNYLDFYFDDAQILRVIGELSDSTVDKRIDVNGIPRSYKGIINEPLNFSFPIIEKEDKNKKIPDLVEDKGRLFLSARAYKVLKPLIENDGEFLPVTYENGQGYFYIPLRVANVDTATTHKNEWDEIVSLGFNEEEVKDWSLFRTEYNGYMHPYCQEVLKTAIEEEQLTGLYITNDLANIFPCDRSQVAKVN